MTDASEPAEQYWKVVGGGDKGGIIVRCGQDASSTRARQRLATGAAVRELQRAGERLEYSLVSGDGPVTGWISLSLKGLALAEPCGKPDPFAALESLKELRDPGWDGELQVNEMDVGGLKAIVRSRPEGAPKAPVAVLMLPGNPVVNSYSADMALPVTVDEALGKAGFPVLRFDWMGVGMNKWDGSYAPNQDYADKVPVAYMMYEAARHLGERIAICTWNFSGTVLTTTAYSKEPDKMFIETLPDVCAVVSLSFAYKQWEFVKRFVNEFAGEVLKTELEAHSKFTVPALYVFGDRDVHTPVESVRAIIEARPDAGLGAEIYVVSQGDQKMNSIFYFMMKDKEGEVATQCATWLSKVREFYRMEDSAAFGA